MVENEALMLAARILALVLLAAASPAGAQNAPVEDTDTLDHAGENAQTLFSRMSLGAPLFDRPDHDEIEPNALSSLPHPAALPLEVPLTL